jgi:YVTN family beta-propeller protein
MNTTKKLLTLSAAITFAVIGCKKDEPSTPETNNNTTGNDTSSVYITNEGPYGSGTGTISLYNKYTGALSNDIFASANGGIPLGNIVQSLSIYNGKGYIVVNNADKIEVVNSKDFKSTATISGLNKPRYFLGIDNNKAYVTEWGATGNEGAVKVINLSTNTVSSTINTGKGAENMVKANNFVYVTCKGGFGNDSVVTVINSSTDAVSTTINVGANPNSVQVDANGKIWVLCGGKWNSGFTQLEKPAKLVRINPSSNTVEATFTFSSIYSGPSNLVINKAKNQLLYVYSGGVYSHEISASNLSNSGLINRYFYGLAVDPSNDYIYAGDAGGFTSNGWVLRYTNSGSVVDSFQVGIAPNGFFFK